MGFIFIRMQMPNYMYTDTTSFKYNSSSYMSLFIMCLVGLGAFVGSGFSELSSKIKTSNYLLMPTSTFEKFLSQFVLRALAGSVIFLIIFWIDAHLARIAALRHIEYSNGQLAGSEKYSYIEKFHYSMFLIKSNYPIVKNWRLFEGIGMILIIFSSGMFLFSVKIFFRKLGLIKTGIALVAAIFLTGVLTVGVSYLFYPETKGFNVVKIGYFLSNGYTNNDIFHYSIGYLAPLFLLPLGYFKLKEKQL